MSFLESVRTIRSATWPERLLNLTVLILSLALAVPVLTTVYLAVTPADNVWPHLVSTVLPGYVWRTIALMAGVGALTFVIGTGTAWLVTMCSFPLRRVFQWALLVPLATPTYIVAYTYVDFLSYSGPLQTVLREAMGWTSPRDYWFPDIRSLSGAIVVLSLVLYPYVFLTARASFVRQPHAHLEVARTLGQSPWGAFYKVALPLARPAIAVGVSLAMMECLNDIGAVGFFGVRTLSLGIYTTWLAQGNLGGAAQIAAVILVFVFGLLWIERQGRTRQAYAPSAQRAHPVRRSKLRGTMAAAAFLGCAVPVVLGFIIPGLILLNFATTRISGNFTSAFANAAWHSFLLSVAAAIFAVILGLCLAYANRLTHSGLVRQTIRIASVGYAMPGTVLGLGILIPVAAFDNALDSFMRESFGVSTGLLLSGSIAAVTYAYVVRFLAISVGSLESGLQRITPNLAAAARTLGRGPLQALREVHLPMLRPSLVTAALLVFVDCMKELPATLILRPFDFETLATTVFTLASLDQLEESALPALTIVAVGLIPVILLSRTLRDPKQVRLLTP
jgi:iron(III) transport system permease protein